MKSEVIRLAIYNSLGERISMLVNQYLAPGTYTKIWTAEDCASGIYFYELQAGNKRITKKMMLVK